MGSGRDQWPALVAGTAIPGLYRLAHDDHALGWATAATGSTTPVKQTRTQPASTGRAVRASGRTTADASGGVVVVAQARHADDRTPSSAGTHGASQSSLWTIVPTDRPVYRNAAQATARAAAAVVGC